MRQSNDDRLFIFQAKEFQIGLIGEAARAVELADPHRHRRAVGDQPEALFALLEQFLRQRLFGDIDMGADQAKRPAGSSRSICASEAIHRTCPSLGRMIRYSDEYCVSLPFTAFRK